MGIGDSVEKAAKNAMEDLAGTARPPDAAHVPEPGAPDEDIRVHSSISEGSNAAGANGQQSRPGNGSRQPSPADKPEDTDPLSTEDSAGPQAHSAGSGAPLDAPGPAGLPSPDPDELRADPSEADEDATKGMGRG